MSSLMRRRLLLLVFAILAGGAVWFWRARPPEVATALARRGPAVEAVYATGTVEPVQLARIGPALRARAIAVLVDEGDRVVAGQPLARLEDRTSRAQLAEVEARATLAQEDLARTRQLVAREIAPRAQLDRAESEARATRAIADAATRRIDDYVMRAPAAGVVLRRDIEPGQISDPMDASFWIGEPRPLRVSAEVDEEDIARIREGQSVVLRADAFPGQVLTATVGQITPKGDTLRKAYRVRLALPDATPLLVGMTVEANIILRRDPDALLVPPAAIRDGRVWVVANGRAEPRVVTQGVQAPTAIEIRAGLAEGDVVILDPPPRLAAGDAVRLGAAARTGAGAPALPGR